MTASTTRTPEEIADLKRQWVADPCWDIETTEGFEAHVDELTRFREEREAAAEAAHTARLAAYRRRVGLTDDQATLGAYLYALEQKINRLQAELQTEIERRERLELAL